MAALHTICSHIRNVKLMITVKLMNKHGILRLEYPVAVQVALKVPTSQNYTCESKCIVIGD